MTGCTAEIIRKLAAGNRRISNGEQNHKFASLTMHRGPPVELGGYEPRELVSAEVIPEHRRLRGRDVIRITMRDADSLRPRLIKSSIR
jgi:hypothetical protein